MGKKKLKEGMILSAKEIYEYDELEEVTKEEFEKLKKIPEENHRKWLEAEEWRKYIIWKPYQTDYYAINIEEGKYKIFTVKHYSKNIASLEHCQENLDALFTWHPLLNTFKYNKFTQKNEFNGERYDEDKKPAEIFNFFRRNFNEWCPRSEIKETIQETLNRNTYHPIIDWLKSLVWDGEERLETFLIKYYKAEDTPLNRVYFKRWMIALIKRILYPGAKFDSMLILAGEQGKKKTTLFNWLGTINGVTYYAEAPDNLKDINNVVYSSLGKMIITFDDFDDICNKGDLGKVKSFITAQARTAALKWQHDKLYEITYVLAASTNQYEILVDDATFDERRFWIVRVNPENDVFDIPEEVKEQLYAEAYYTFLQDEEQRLWIWESELKEAEKQHQKEYKKAGSDPVTEKIVGIFNRKYPIVNGMFDNEEHFIKCIKDKSFNNKCDELASDMVGTSWEYIKMIPSAWIIRYLDDEKYNRGTDRIIQILYSQGFNVEKKNRHRCYGCQQTAIIINYK